jgi:hypothetical protein
MLDERGPCLLEVGARLVGGDPEIDSWQHDLDLVEAALNQYLGDGTCERLALNWERYDSQIAGQVSGFSTRAGRIGRVRGLDRAEALPGFLRWDFKPVVGDKVVATVDLSGTCWNIVAVAPDRATWRDRARALHSTVELDVLGPGIRRPLLRLRVLAQVTARLVRRGVALVTIR